MNLLQLEAYFKVLSAIFNNALTLASQQAISAVAEDLAAHIECVRHQENADWNAAREERTVGVWH